MPQYQFVCDQSNEIIVDFVGRFENISDDFERIKQRLNIKVDLGYENKTERKHYKKYYTKDSIELVQEIYAMDFELFQYEF